MVSNDQWCVYAPSALERLVDNSRIRGVRIDYVETAELCVNRPEAKQPWRPRGESQHRQPAHDDSSFFVRQRPSIYI